MSQRLNTPDQQGYFHFVTINVRDRRRPFAHDDYAQMVLKTLRFECDRHPAELVVYVVMPDHLHFILLLEDGSLTRFLMRFKPNVTRNLDALLERDKRTKAREWLSRKGHRELWQDGKHSLILYSTEWMEEKIIYIHNNPVRSGLCEKVQDYAWSSYNAYEGIGEPPVPVDLWKG